MSDVSRFFTTLVSWGISLALVGACLRNVFGSSLEVEQKAVAAACGERPGCGAQMTRMMRTPIEHSYAFVARGRQVDVDCRREFILVGDYACKDSSSDLSRLTAAPAPAVTSRPLPPATPARAATPAKTSKPAPSP